MTRLAVYSAMRENGKSVQESAAYAKEVTVNFNRRGAIGKSRWPPKPCGQ